MAEPLITISNSKCITCYACIKACPVKAIQIKPSSEFPFIVPQRCIGCGSCIKVCSPDAITYRSSIEEAKKLLASNDNVTAITSTAISGEFDDISDYRKFVQMIKSLGFQYVVEVAFGVDLIAFKYSELFNDFKGKYYITSHDPVVVSYIEKFRPELIGNLAPLISPKIAITKVIRKKYGKDMKVVYISHDIASKDEVLKYKGSGKIDCALTFTELRQLFDEFNINENLLEFSDFDPPTAYKGSLFPISNGIIQAAEMDENLLTTKVTTIVGKNNMMYSLEEFETKIDLVERHLNIFYNDVLLGPGMSKGGEKLIRESNVIKYANKRLSNFFRFEWNQNLQEYLNLNFSRTFTNDDQRLPEPTEDEINKILHSLNKSTGQYTDCHKCGYTSCRDFAISVAQGLTTPEMCVTFSLKKDLSAARSLHVTNERLEALQKALEESEEKARTEKQTAESASELANSMLNKLRAGVLVADSNLKILKSNQSLISIMGQEAQEINDVIPELVGADLKKLMPFDLYKLFSYCLTSGENIENRDIQVNKNLLNVSIFNIKKHEILGAIIRDMNAPEVQRVEVINRVSEVIDKNLEMVQKIGFLLGEGASDIEKMLNSIIEFYKTENKQTNNKQTNK